MILAQADALHVPLSDVSVQCIVTSPPSNEARLVDSGVIEALDASYEIVTKGYFDLWYSASFRPGSGALFARPEVHEYLGLTMFQSEIGHQSFTNRGGFEIRHAP